MTDIHNDIDQCGFAFRRQALDDRQLAHLLVCLQPTVGGSEPGLRAGAAYTARNLLWGIPNFAAALATVGLDAVVTDALGRDAFPINALWFDKRSEANWKVPPHQDLMMPVERQMNEPGFTGWSEKGGVLHVEPPTDVLSQLLAVRVHFDPCPASNGPLAVAPGSHLRGKLRDADILAIGTSEFVSCTADPGDVLLMRPLLVHRSSPALTPSHRRVLHIVYATEQPGSALRWKSVG